MIIAIYNAMVRGNLRVLTAYLDALTRRFGDGNGHFSHDLNVLLLQTGHFSGLIDNLVRLVQSAPAILILELQSNSY